MLSQALEASHRLVEILPCPESRILQALVLEATGKIEEALAVVVSVEAGGYQTRRTTTYRSRYLLAAGQPDEAAEVIEPLYSEAQSKEYSVAWQLGTALAANDQHERAIAVLAPLRGDARAGIELYVNLGRAYLLSSAGIPEMPALRSMCSARR